MNMLDNCWRSNIPSKRLFKRMHPRELHLVKVKKKNKFTVAATVFWWRNSIQSDLVNGYKRNYTFESISKLNWTCVHNAHFIFIFLIGCVHAPCIILSDFICLNRLHLTRFGWKFITKLKPLVKFWNRKQTKVKLKTCKNTVQNSRWNKVE